MISYLTVVQHLLENFVLKRKFSKLFFENGQCFFNHSKLCFEVLHHKNISNSLVKLPFKSPKESQQLHTELSSPDLYCFSFWKFVFLYKLRINGVILKIIFTIQMEIDVVVFVVLESHSVSHQHHSVGESPVTKEYLRVLLELIFGAAQHQELIKGLFWPLFLKIVYSMFWFRRFFLFAILCIGFFLIILCLCVVCLCEFTQSLFRFYF